MTSAIVGIDIVFVTQWLMVTSKEYVLSATVPGYSTESQSIVTVVVVPPSASVVSDVSTEIVDPLSDTKLGGLAREQTKLQVMLRALRSVVAVNVWVPTESKFRVRDIAESGGVVAASITALLQGSEISTWKLASRL